MPDVNFHDAIGGQHVGDLGVQYDPGDPTITLALTLPTHIVTKGPVVDLRIDNQLFKGTAFSVGNTVVDVTPDPQTADTIHLLGTPVYLVTASSTMEALRDQPFVTDGDATADLPNSVDVNTLSFPVASLDDVGDVNAPTPANADVLTWDSTPGEWIAQAPAAVPSALDDLTDVNAPTPADGDTLTWDAGTSKWIASAPTGGGGPAGHYEILVDGTVGPVPITTADLRDYVYIFVPD